MSQISATAVKNLRDRTGQPMMDCKAALTEAGGDMEKAVLILQKRGKDVADKKGARETAEGRIGAYIDTAQKVGCLIEMRCESPPVIKSEHFVKLTNDLAKQVAVKNPANVEELLSQPFVDDPKKTVQDRITDVVGLIRENMKPARFIRLPGLLGSYCHHDGSIGVLLQVEGASADPQLLRDICMHITAKDPAATKREDVTEAELARQKEIAESQAAASGKPANIAAKIAEGKIKTWFAERILVEQPFVKDDSKTVGEVLKGAGLNIIKFIRFRVGEV